MIADKLIARAGTKPGALKRAMRRADRQARKHERRETLKPKKRVYQ